MVQDFGTPKWLPKFCNLLSVKFVLRYPQHIPQDSTAVNPCLCPDDLLALKHNLDCLKNVCSAVLHFHYVSPRKLVLFCFFLFATLAVSITKTGV